MILTLTSDTYSQGELYDFASTQLAQTIAQIDGVGDVDVGGSSLPTVRVGLNPQALFNQGVSLDDVRSAIANANVRKPQGAIENDTHRWQVQTNDELKTAAEYQPIIIHYNNGAAVRLGDVASVSDSVQDVRNAGMTNAKPAILLMIRKLPEANIIQTVDSIRAKLPELQTLVPAAIDLQIARGPFTDHSRLAGGSRTDADYLRCAGYSGGLCFPALRARDPDPCGSGSGLADRYLCRHVSVRIQPEQPVINGVDHCHGICR